MSDFVIRERVDLGGFLPRETPAEFRWTAAGRSSPLQPWGIGTVQRFARTDYAGTDNPSIQVLGPNYVPQIFEGSWLNRHNPIGGPKQPGETEQTFRARATGRLADGGAVASDSARGFAYETMAAFEAMVRRGNTVQIEFEAQSFVGIISDFSAKVFHRGHIDYSFKFEALRRTGTDEIKARISPETNEDSLSIAKRLESLGAGISSDNDTRPAPYIAGSLSTDAQSDLDDLVAGTAALKAVSRQRILRVDGETQASVAKAVSAANNLIETGKNLRDRVKNASHFNSLIHQDPVAALSFETWSRSLSAGARLTIFEAWKARTRLERQAAPDAIALYRGYRGQTLYQVSQIFYGSPLSAEAIRARNGLRDNILTGDTLLVIPKLATKAA